MLFVWKLGDNGHVFSVHFTNAKCRELHLCCSAELHKVEIRCVVQLWTTRLFATKYHHFRKCGMLLQWLKLGTMKMRKTKCHNLTLPENFNTKDSSGPTVPPTIKHIKEKISLWDGTAASSLSETSGRWHRHSDNDWIECSVRRN